MNIHLLYLTFFLLTASSAFAQTVERIVHQADSLFWAGEYQKSQTLYAQASTLIGESNTIPFYLSIQKESECLVREGFFDQAEEKIAHALQRCPTKALSSKAGLLNVLGLSKIGQGEYNEAETALNEAIQITSTINTSQEALSDSYNNLSILFWTTGHNEKALEYALNALELRQKMHTENSPLVAGSYMNLGLLYQHDKHEQAIIYYDKAIAIYSSAFHSNHPLIASALINKGIVYQSEKTYNSALEQFEKALHIIDASVGKNHINYAFTLSHIGKVYLDKKNPLQAEQYKSQALTIFIANFGDKHPEVAQCYKELAAIKLYQKNTKRLWDTIKNH